MSHEGNLENQKTRRQQEQEWRFRMSFWTPPKSTGETILNLLVIGESSLMRHSAHASHGADRVLSPLKYSTPNTLYIFQISAI